MIGRGGDLFDAAFGLLRFGYVDASCGRNRKNGHRHDMGTAEAILFVLAAEGLISRVWERDCCRSWCGVENIISAGVGHENAYYDDYECQ